MNKMFYLSAIALCTAAAPVILSGCNAADVTPAPAAVSALSKSDSSTSPAYLSQTRSRELFVDDWKFNLEDSPGFAAPEHDDGAWRSLSLPHDWSIEGEYKEDNPAGFRGGFLPGGIGWYRKTFTKDPAWNGKAVSINFDGIYMNATIYVNGKKRAHQPYGYVGINIDLTDDLIDGENVISVRVDNEKLPSGRWYTGSGIYRDVWLSVSNPVHVINNGSYITTPSVTSAKAEVKTRHEVRNPGNTALPVTARIDVLNSNGVSVVKTEMPAILPAGQVTTLDMDTAVLAPKLWSPDTPNLYKVKFTLSGADGREIDSYVTTTGFRDIQFTVDRGFLINGQAMEIQGMCMHHDGGAVGAAVPEDVLRHRLQMLKDAGVNAIRTAHNPFAPEFYRLADEMGFMLMNEAFDGWETEKAAHDYGHYFEAWWERDLTNFIRRDRNHPSVIMWSVGNEVKDPTAETQKKLTEHIKALDPTRPVTQGRGYFLPYNDIAGFNGHGEYVNAIKEFHAENPDMPVIGTEITHTLHTRGVYRSKTEIRERDVKGRNGKLNRSRWNKMKDRVYDAPDFTAQEVWPADDRIYASSFDNNIVRMPIREEIKLARELPYLLGTFRWTAFDYLGESRGWPARTTNFGVIDLADLPKGAYYLYQSQWSRRPMVHLDPHWTHPGRDGVVMPVVAYTNMNDAELFLNEKSLGKKPMTDELQIVWKVPYAPGELKVVATGKTGETRTMSHRTAGKPAALSVTASRTSMPADNRSVARYIVDIIDAKGEFVPHASNRVTVSVTGGARLIGVENGDIMDHTSSKGNVRDAFNGKMVALVQSDGTAKPATVTFSSEGLEPAEHDIKITPAR